MKIVKWSILVCAVLAGLWIVPALMRKAAHQPDDYPFVYYSSLLGQFALIDYGDKELPMTDMQGRRYSESQMDSLTPLLSFRQLASDGRMPDSVLGVAVDQQILRVNSVNFRYDPRDADSPTPGLYVLFESMPRRVGLTVPPDVFRLRDKIEFIDAATNSVDVKKSERFAKALSKAGFTFPAQWAEGNPTPRKAYDEGYFALDARGGLFHIKMVNGRPYVHDTGVSDVASFSIYEVPSKRFYGFVFDRAGRVYILEEGYRLVPLEMGPLDLRTDQMTVMGNILYWTVMVNTPTGRRYYGLDAATLRQVCPPHTIARAARWCDNIPRLTFQHKNSGYVFPKFEK